MREALTLCLSIVIPTRDRLASLQRALAALERQQAVAGSFEVIVADDGSRDGTAAFLAAPPPLPVPLLSTRRPGSSGRAAARN
ncbi:MAG: glycosyltransferase family A protein, partial [Thermoanaerobaculia bacterium]